MQDLPASLPVGTVIHEHYSIESLLGKAGFGNVYLVRDQRDEQKLFVLAELTHPAENESYRFVLNYVSLAPLNRGMLPRVQYAHNDDRFSHAYLLMNYIEEPNLEVLRLRQAEQRFPLQRVVSIMKPVIDAVTYLHHQHPPIIHGNIHPSNIIVSQTLDAPVLAMLNLSKEHDSLTTPLYYFAPGYGASEQYDGNLDIRSDVYGLGATYYTLLTGIVPPDALTRSTQVSNGEIDPLQPADEAIPAIPSPVVGAIQRAMALDASQRFSSVEEFHREIIDSAGSSPPEAVAVVLPEILSSPIPSGLQPPEPDTSHPGVPDGLQPMVSGQVDEKPVPAPVPVKPRPGRVRKSTVLLVILVLLICAGAGIDFWFHVRSLPTVRTPLPTATAILSSPTPSLTATTSPSVYPALTGMYSGTIFDVSANVSTNMSLTNMRQNQGNISGYLTLGPHIKSSGPFRGTIDVTRHFHFVVTDAVGNARLYFEGAMQSTTTLSGDYYSCSLSSPLQGNQCNRASGSFGIWNVVLT